MALMERRVEKQPNDKDYLPDNLESPRVAGRYSQNVRVLGQLLTHLSHLHSEGEISDKAFETLTQYAFSMFVEDLVQQKINVLESKLLKILRNL